MAHGRRGASQSSIVRTFALSEVAEARHAEAQPLRGHGQESPGAVVGNPDTVLAPARVAVIPALVAVGHDIAQRPEAAVEPVDGDLADARRLDDVAERNHVDGVSSYDTDVFTSCCSRLRGFHRTSMR